jgi:cytochrome oxidase Cu insertion factor (SCO1/SenC/PrrC family)
MFEKSDRVGPIPASTPLKIGAAVVLTGLLSLLTPACAHEGHHHGDAGEMVSSPQVYVKAPPPPETLGRPFELMDHHGQTVTNASYTGKWLLIFFGFAGCREACPTGLVSMQAAIDALGDEAERVQPLFVDVSMEEPDITGLAEFVSNFHPRLVGLTGTRAQTFTTVRDFKIRREYAMASYSTKETGPRINHTTYLYLVDPSGVTRAYFDHTLEPERMALTMRLNMKRRRVSQ